MPEKKKGLTYERAGVNISAAKNELERMKIHIESTHDECVLGGVGPFASAVDLRAIAEELGIEHPIMLQSVDGAGTIPLIAEMQRDLEGPGSFIPLGYNVAAHCFADVVCGGGQPITLLDCISSTDVNPEVCEEIVAGMAEACQEIGCRLIGGETAQLPGLIVKGQTDCVGFVTALVDRKDWIQPQERIKPGQLVLGIESTGIHLNGLSLFRKIVFELLEMKPDDIFEGTGRTVAGEVLRRQPNYASIVMAEMKREKCINISANSHITGGGLYDNIERNLPENCRVNIDRNRWQVPSLFEWLIENGADKDDAWSIWNMGIGFVQIFPTLADLEAAEKLIRKEFGLATFRIGEVVEGERGVEFIN